MNSLKSTAKRENKAYILLYYLRLQNRINFDKKMRL